MHFDVGCDFLPSWDMCCGNDRPYRILHLRGPRAPGTLLRLVSGVLMSCVGLGAGGTGHAHRAH